MGMDHAATRATIHVLVVSAFAVLLPAALIGAPLLVL
jgi:hypothetical protein